MATWSPWSSPWRRMTDRSNELSSSSSSFDSAIVFTSRTIRRNHTRLTISSVDPPSSKPDSSHSRGVRKRMGRSGNKSVLFVEDSKTESRDRTGLSLKSLFGRRSLWKRILFASTKVRSILLLNVITIVYASNIPVIKEVEAIMDPAAFTVVRFSTAAIPFIPFVLQARGDAQTRNAGIELGIWLSLGYIMQALGLLTSDAGRASFISMFTVIVVPLLDGMLGALVPAHTWFGALMSLLGVAMLESSGSPPAIGDLYNFMGAVFFGIHMLRTEHISRKTDKENFLSLIGYEVCVVAVLSALWYLPGGWFDGVQKSDPSSWKWTVVWNWMTTFPWIPALYTGIFSTVLCLWVEMAAMCDVSATETAIIYGLEPVWGAGFAWFLLGERWGTLGWIGAALVVGGSLTVQILGSSTLTLSEEEDECLKQTGQLLTPDEGNGTSASPVVVSSSKDVPNTLKK